MTFEQKYANNSSTHKFSVLLADDFEELRGFNAEILETMHVTVTQAGTAAGAQIRIAKEKFDLILLDLNLSGITTILEGLHLAESRVFTRNKDTPTFILSGQAGDPEVLEACKDANVTLLVKGSYKLEEIVAQEAARQQKQLV